MNLPDLSSVAQLAEALGCEPEAVQARALTGDLPGIKFGRGWVFPREAVLEALNRQARDQAEARRAAQQPSAVAVAALRPTGRAAKRSLPVLPSLSSPNAER